MLAHGLVAADRVLGLADLGAERMRVTLQTALDRLLPILLVVQVVVAIDAVAQVAKLATRKAVAVQLKALRLGAVARLARPDAVALHVRLCAGGSGIGGGGRRFQRLGRLR